jgi:hypothetical protein
MSRSPWREALDGQIQIIRTLRSISSVLHLGQNVDTPEVRQLVPEKERYIELQMKAGQALAEGIETVVREAEPIYLSHDIQEAMCRAMDRIAAVSNEAAQEIGTRMRLTADMLPIPKGLVWLTSGYWLVDVPSDDVRMAQGAVFIRAIYFGDDVVMSMYPSPLTKNIRIDVTTDNADTRRNTMGMTLFLESQKSGYTYLTEQFGNHLVPVPLGAWPYGETLDDRINAEDRTAKAVGVNSAGTKALMAVSGAYLHILFTMMLQQVTRWGGVGLSREERRDAEHERLRPRVQLITWRKAQYKYPEGHIPVPKNWSCRWPVRTHWRHYKSGKVVEIKSYVKGPPSKPFRDGTRHAHQVIR